MITSVLLLPLFFALTGLRTRLDLLSGASTWLWAGIVFVAAVVGKVGGATLAARWSGQSWRYALGLGALLNTRGLVELIVLNIAYQVGVFSPTLFTMLVVMALANNHDHCSGAQFAWYRRTPTAPIGPRRYTG